MVKAVLFDKVGGPEVMKWVDIEVGEPGNGEIRIKQHAVGLNYIDVYFRTGLNPLPLPSGLGMEAAVGKLLTSCRKWHVICELN